MSSVMPLHHRNGAQPAHDAADAQRVGIGLPQSVLQRNLKIVDDTRIVSAHLNGIDDKIRSGQRLLAGFRRPSPWRGLHSRCGSGSSACPPPDTIFS